MKKIIASAGMLALGIVASKATDATVTAPTDKAWGISSSLRGFYDDNYAQSHSDAQSSYGISLSPSAHVDLVGQQTTFHVEASTTLRHYFDRPGDDNDHTYQFGMALAHQFTERYSVDLHDELVYSQEPTLTSGGTSSVIRSDGSVLRNEGAINFHAQLTRLFGIVTGYRNVLYSYEDQSYSALLNRIEHYANIDFTWQVAPQTVALIGYQFGLIDYTSGDNTTFINSTGASVLAPADIRNSRSHYIYVGLERHFTPQLTGSLKVGAQYIEYYNLPSGSSLSQNKWGPYARSSLRYNYQPTSYVEFGTEHQRTQTDINSATDGSSTTMFATLSHSFTPKFIASVTGLAQYTEYDNTFGPTTHDWLYQIGLNLEYRFTRNVSGNFAYNFDDVDSDIANRGYNRNRVFLGATVSY